MVLKIYTHHMACDRRPIMATHPSTDQPSKVMVDPYAQPIRCDPEACPGDRDAEPLCRWHTCCRVRERVLGCPRGHQAQASRSRLPHSRMVNHDCAMVHELHTYEQSTERCRLFPSTEAASATCAPPVIATTTPPWPLVPASAETDDMLKRWRTAPRETLTFAAARRALFRAGRDLHAAKRRVAERTRGDDEACRAGSAERQVLAREMLVDAREHLRVVRGLWRLWALQVFMEEQVEGDQCVVVDDWFEALRREFRALDKMVLLPLR
ncbi:hypothetical protein MCOR02_010259 [Pyricularia oryzae]|uniref:Uncharacterized protein n=1 Tax=Pyricularia oryzae TaxID=318829 RepID=A0A4P7NNU8_PYROR|nr:hypothetical protein MCOR02_010259 [Pyricularia oryzae]KAI6320899.1 hypothetical protein MCOR34_002821 [Pyricularia oryzae]KAI6476625.1 hypothetical protein MCOR17_000961 [Pyricularia oryzae]KAI6509592.1 hypothetical protein MCOR13_001491 [Pyricularia oryzae]KAI6592153.1 hypothetical protein MCOR04_003586 [Pyricularia oryzae]